MSSLLIALGFGLLAVAVYFDHIRGGRFQKTVREHARFKTVRATGTGWNWSIIGQTVLIISVLVGGLCLLVFMLMAFVGPRAFMDSFTHAKPRGARMTTQMHWRYTTNNLQVTAPADGWSEEYKFGHNRFLAWGPEDPLRKTYIQVLDGWDTINAFDAVLETSDKSVRFRSTLRNTPLTFTLSIIEWKEALGKDPNPGKRIPGREAMNEEVLKVSGLLILDTNKWTKVMGLPGTKATLKPWHANSLVWVRLNGGRPKLYGKSPNGSTNYNLGRFKFAEFKAKDRSTIAYIVRK